MARDDTKITLSQLRLLAGILFTSHKKVVYMLLCGQLCISLLYEIVGYLLGLLPSRFYLILEAKPEARSHSQFVGLVVYATVAMVIVTFIKASKMLVTGLLYITWRDALTTSLHRKYFQSSHSAYKVNMRSVGKDNPDQRIASDASAVCNDLSQFVPVLIISPFTISYYTYQCWLTTGYIGPLAIFTFFIVATVISKLLMDPVAKWTYRQEQFEGDFRYCHMMVRTNCESSALYQLNKVEQRQTNDSLSSLLAVQERLTLFKYMQNLFVVLCDYIVVVLSYVMVSIPIFAGKYDNLSGGEIASLVSQYSFKSMTLFSCFTTLIDLSKQAATLLGNSQRVADFIQALEIIGQSSDDGKRRMVSSVTTSSGVTHSDTHVLVEPSSQPDVISEESYEMIPFDSMPEMSIVELRNITVRVPSTGRLLVGNFTHSFKQGINVLITGPSGVGKSSLLRVIGRVWSAAGGHVTVRGSVGYNSTVSIVPQKPYFLAGSTSLADQIYLGEPPPPGHTAVLDLLKSLDLEELVNRHNSIDTQTSNFWYDELTPGEAQRLAIVRALYHKPVLLFLDEATSQVDAANERKIYEMLSSSDITVVSVGHRLSLRQYHSLEIVIREDGSYTTSPIA